MCLNIRFSCKATCDFEVIIAPCLHSPVNQSEVDDPMTIANRCQEIHPTYPAIIRAELARGTAYFPRTRGLGKKVCGCTALHPTSLPRLLRLCARGRWFVLGRRDEPRRTVPVQRVRFPFQSAAWIGFNRQVSLLSTPTVETSRSGPQARTHDSAIRIRSSHERIVEARGRASRIRDVSSDA